LDLKLVKWEKETMQESIRLRSGSTRVPKIRRPADAAIPQRIFR